MQILIDRKPMVEALTLANRVIEKRGNIPLLKAVRLNVADGVLQLEVTDCDLWLRQALACETDNDVAPFAVDCESLLSALRNVPCDAPALRLIDGQLNVEGGRGAVRLPVMNASPEDWPAPRATGGAPAAFTLPGAFAGDLATAAVGMSTDEARYYLRGVYMHRQGESMHLAATDGHRLIKVARPAPEGFTADAHGIIPAKAVKLFGGIKHDGPVNATLGKDKVTFELGSVTIVSKLIDGIFPEYSRVIPNTTDSWGFKADATAVRDALKGLVSRSNKYRSTVLKTEVGYLNLQHFSEDTRSEQSIPAEIIGQPLTTAFNVKYLAGILALGRKGDCFTFLQWDGGCPAHITFNGRPELTIVIMPMHGGGDNTHRPAPRATRVDDNPSTPSINEEDMARIVRESFKARWLAARNGQERGAAVAYARAALRYNMPDGARGLRFSILTAISEALNVKSRKANALLRSVLAPNRHCDWKLHEYNVRQIMEAVAVRNAIPGYHPADPRDVLPVTLTNGQKRHIRKSDLARGAKRHDACLTITNQDGTVRYSGSGARRAYRSARVDQIAEIRLPAAQAAWVRRAIAEYCAPARNEPVQSATPEPVTTPAPEAACSVAAPEGAPEGLAPPNVAEVPEAVETVPTGEETPPEGHAGASVDAADMLAAIMARLDRLESTVTEHHAERPARPARAVRERLVRAYLRQRAAREEARRAVERAQAALQALEAERQSIAARLERSEVNRRKNATRARGWQKAERYSATLLMAAKAEARVAIEGIRVASDRIASLEARFARAAVDPKPEPVR